MADITTQPGKAKSERSRVRLTENPATIRERWLLIMAGLFVMVAHTGLTLAQRLSPFDYWRVVVWALCAVVGHWMLQQRLPRRDPILFPVVMLLTGWGLVLIGRLEPAFADRQTLWLMLTSGVMLAIVRLPGHLRWLSRYRYLWLALGLALLFLTILIGRNPTDQENGPHLWLGFSDVYFQPAELLKVLLVAFLASYLADNHTLLDLDARRIGPLTIPSPGFLAPLLVLWGLSIAVLVGERDLGMALIYFIIFIAMLYIANGRTIYIIGGIAVLIIAGVVGYSAIGVVRQRITIWANPWSQAKAGSFQIVQSLLAFSAGGIFGQGVGQGSPGYIPVVHSDFVLAAVGEEWGLLGTLTVTACLAVIVVRGLRIAAQTQQRPFQSFMAAGLSVTLAAQSFIIMGGVIKLIPLTGITLPFLSYGGSSLLSCLITTGLLLVISNDASRAPQSGEV